jgi:hypothetical protein
MPCAARSAASASACAGGTIGSARRVARVATGGWRERHLRIDANADGEYDEPSPDWGRPLVVGRDHPSWPEVDAEQRERVGDPLGEGGQL